MGGSDLLSYMFVGGEDSPKLTKRPGECELQANYQHQRIKVLSIAWLCRPHMLGCIQSTVQTTLSAMLLEIARSATQARYPSHQCQFQPHVLVCWHHDLIRNKETRVLSTRVLSIWADVRPRQKL